MEIFVPNVDYMTQALEVKPVSERHRVQHNTDLSDVRHAFALLQARSWW